MPTDAAIAQLFVSGITTHRIAATTKLSQRRVQQLVQHLQPDKLPMDTPA